MPRTAHSPIIIGHRGASGHRPEHTLASYWLAIQQGADFIEPDLVATRDGVLVARHENEISTTTNVAEHPKFAERHTTKTIDGRTISGFFTEDFSLAELKTLRAKERLPVLRPHNCQFDGLFTIPTLDEVITLAKIGSRITGRRIGVYPETKHPTYFADIGLALEEPLLRTLQRRGYRGSAAAVFIQSFEVSNLQRLCAVTDLPLIQLIDATGQPYDFTPPGDTRTYADLITPAGLATIAAYATGIGVHKDLIIPRTAEERMDGPSHLITNAHAAGLSVHAWTFRRENAFLPAEFRAGTPADADFAAQSGNLIAECRRYLALGLDGLFSDNPALAVSARRAAGLSRARARR